MFSIFFPYVSFAGTEFRSTSNIYHLDKVSCIKSFSFRSMAALEFFFWRLNMINSETEIKELDSMFIVSL